MSRFCNACGTPNEDDAAFCDNCGAPIRRPAAQTRQGADTGLGQKPSVRPAPRINTKTLVWSGIGAAALLVSIGGGVWGWQYFQKQPPSVGDQVAVAQQWLDRNKADLLRRACLNNFAYRQSQVSVAAWNRETRVWLDALVAGDVYSSNGTDAYGNYLYVHGPKASKYIQGGSLCLADAVNLEKTELVASGETEKALLSKTEDGHRFAAMTVTYGWANLPDFANAPPVSNAWPGGMKNTRAELTLYRGDDGWREASEADKRLLRQQMMAVRNADRQTASDSGASFSLGRWFGQLFSFGGGPDRVAVTFTEAMATGDVKTALGQLHPEQRSDTTDAKIGMAIEMKRQATNRAGFELSHVDAEVERETDERAVVQVVVNFKNGHQERERVTLQRHNGTWYVVLM